jgi:hypothetical protein
MTLKPQIADMDQHVEVIAVNHSAGNAFHNIVNVLRGVADHLKLN